MRPFLVSGILCCLLFATVSVDAFSIVPDTDEVTLALARRAARAFCERFDFPAEKKAEIDGNPVSGPVSLERDGEQVTSVRWLGGCRGDYCVQVEVYSSTRRVVVYGGYNHIEFGPWAYKEPASQRRHTLTSHAAELAHAAERAHRDRSIALDAVARAR